MNKWDFIKQVAAKTGKTQTEINDVLNGTIDVLVEQVRDNGESIALPGLGTFKQKATEPHEGHNPMNGEKITVRGSRTIAFKPQASLKVVE